MHKSAINRLLYDACPSLIAQEKPPPSRQRTYGALALGQEVVRRASTGEEAAGLNDLAVL